MISRLDAFAVVLLAAALCLGAGYGWGRRNGRRALNQARREGYARGIEVADVHCPRCDCTDVIGPPAPFRVQAGAVVDEPETEPCPSCGSLLTYSHGPGCTITERLQPGHCFGCGSDSHLWMDCPANPHALAGHTIYADLTPERLDDLADELGAEIEAHLARRFETAAEWEARMAYEHALWCAEAGLVNEWAAA